MSIIGADRVRRALQKMPERMKKQVAEANHKSGAELIRIAKVLIPEVSGDSRAAIIGTANSDGSYLCDFGPKAKVIEGERGPRPFVNPALSVTRKRHSARAKRAMNKAVKEAFGG
jgi:hypothetical protein